jgi:hypothetical protein
MLSDFSIFTESKKASIFVIQMIDAFAQKFKYCVVSKNILIIAFLLSYPMPESLYCIMKYLPAP